MEIRPREALRDQVTQHRWHVDRPLIHGLVTLPCDQHGRAQEAGQTPRGTHTSGTRGRRTTKGAETDSEWEMRSPGDGPQSREPQHAER